MNVAIEQCRLQGLRWDDLHGVKRRGAGYTVIGREGVAYLLVHVNGITGQAREASRADAFRL